MKGAIGLAAICMVVWIFWMTYVWLSNNPNKKSKKQPKNNKK